MLSLNLRTKPEAKLPKSAGHSCVASDQGPGGAPGRFEPQPQPAFAYSSDLRTDTFGLQNPALQNPALQNPESFS